MTSLTIESPLVFSVDILYRWRVDMIDNDIRCRATRYYQNCTSKNAFSWTRGASLYGALRQIARSVK